MEKMAHLVLTVSRENPVEQVTWAPLASLATKVMLEKVVPMVILDCLDLWEKVALKVFPDSLELRDNRESWANAVVEDLKVQWVFAAVKVLAVPTAWSAVSARSDFPVHLVKMALMAVLEPQALAVTRVNLARLEELDHQVCPVSLDV